MLNSPEHIEGRTIEWHPGSFVDPSGRVFMWRGGVYRAIVPSAAERVRVLLAHPRVSALQERGAVISAEVAPISVPDAAFVLEHPRIPFVTYAYEWTPEMLRDAALRTLEVAEEILDAGAVLQDATPKNIVFDAARPVFVDIGSFVPAPRDTLWAPYEQFCATFLFPLSLAAAGCAEAARALFLASPEGISMETYARTLPLREKLRHPMRYLPRRWSAQVARWMDRRGLDVRVRAASERTVRTVDLPRARRRFFASLHREVASFSFPRTASVWGTYDADTLSHRSAAQDARKAGALASLLQRIAPSSIADIGANAGLFAAQVAQVFFGTRVIAIEPDIVAAEACYTRARATSAFVHTAIVDVLNPSPALGWCGREYAPATERLRADVAMGLALIHHLAITRRQGFDRALAALEGFATRAVLVEFIGPRDPMVTRLMRQSRFAFPWYTWDHFLRTVTQRSASIICADPHAEDRRMVLYTLPSQRRSHR